MNERDFINFHAGERWALEEPPTTRAVLSFSVRLTPGDALFPFNLIAVYVPLHAYPGWFISTTSVTTLVNGPI